MYTVKPGSRTQRLKRATCGLMPDGFLLVQRQDEDVEAYLNELPNTELVSWARARLLAAYANDETAAVEDVGALTDLSSVAADGVRYCVAPLWARVNNEDVVVAALALGFRNGTPKLPGADVLSVIAASLLSAARASEYSELQAAKV